MFKITKTKQLGNMYTITDSKGDPLGTIQVIPSTEILDVAFGEYDETYLSYSDYLTQSIECFSGFETNQLYYTLWWTTSAKNHTNNFNDELTQAFEYAIQHGYSTIIIETIPTDE